MLTDEFQNRLLAVLFAATEPITPDQLVGVFADIAQEDIAAGLSALAEQFNSWQQAVEIQRVAGGYRIVTRPVHHETIREYLKTKPSAKLSHAALETLAVIAYRQPVTLPEIMEIRGIKGTSTIKTLLEKKLIEMKGRKKVVGRPILYGTTQEFLIHFGLDDLSELPSLEEFEELLASDSGSGVGEPNLSEE